MTQNEAVYRLLQLRGEQGVTALDALREVGSFRLAARIHDLIEDGHNITSTMEVTPQGKHIARYRLVEATPDVWQQSLLPLESA